MKKWWMFLSLSPCASTSAAGAGAPDWLDFQNICPISVDALGQGFSMSDTVGPTQTKLRQLRPPNTHFSKLALLNAKLAISRSCLQSTHGCTDNYQWITLSLKHQGF